MKDSHLEKHIFFYFDSNKNCFEMQRTQDEQYFHAFKASST